MKLMQMVVLVIAGSIGVSVAISRQPASPVAQPAAPTSLPAETPPSQPDNLRQVLSVFRSDLNASKVRALNQVMKLTTAEAEKFWPIYQKYEAELVTVNDRRVEMIREFVKLSSTGSLTDQNAATLANKWLGFAQDRLDLWKKYHDEIGRVVSPIRAAQFLQVEHQISLLVDINIASEMPLVDAPK